MNPDTTPFWPYAAVAVGFTLIGIPAYLALWRLAEVLITRAVYRRRVRNVLRFPAAERTRP